LFFFAVFATIVSSVGYKRKSLSMSGAISGWFTGFVSGFCGGYAAALALLAFFVTSSALTKYKQSVKNSSTNTSRKEANGRQFKFSAMQE